MNEIEIVYIEESKQEVTAVMAAHALSGTRNPSSATGFKVRLEGMGLRWRRVCQTANSKPFCIVDGQRAVIGNAWML